MKGTSLFLLIAYFVSANAVVKKDAIQKAVNAFSKINNAPTIGKFIRYGCSLDPTVLSVVQQLNGATPAALNCFYNQAVSYKSDAQAKNVDFNVLIQKVSEGVVRKCTSYMGQFTVIPYVQQILTMSPSSLISVDGFPTSAKNILDKVAALFADVAATPGLVTKPAQYGPRIKAIVQPAINMNAADRKAIAKIYPDAGPFILPNGANKKAYNNYLKLLQKSANGKLKAADKKKFKKVFGKLSDMVVKIGISIFQKQCNNIDSVNIPAKIQADTKVNSAVKVLAPFFVTKAKLFLANSKFVAGLVTLASEYSAFCAVYPDPFVAAADSAKNTLKYSIKIPWNALPF